MSMRICPLFAQVQLLLLVFVVLVLLVLESTTNAFVVLPNNHNNIATRPTRPNTRITTSNLYEAPVTFAGTGPRQVDMNQYNLPLDVIEQQWIANIVAKTVDTEGGIFLGVENNRELFVDVVTVSLPRSSKSQSQSLGIGLVELAGGRSDGIGITVVSELIEGGLVDTSGVDIMPGDSISSISVVRKNQSFVPTSTSSNGNDNDNNNGNGSGSMLLSDNQETITARTECLGYDATVDAIRSLPPVQSNDEQLIIKVKRLRRKPIITVNLKYPPSTKQQQQKKQKDETIQLYAGENLRLGMLVRGVTLNDPLAKRFDTKSGGNCGAGGLCRTCAVSVLRGGELLNPQKVAEKQMLQDNPRWRLGCKAFVGYGMKEGEISIQVNPRQW